MKWFYFLCFISLIISCNNDNETPEPTVGSNTFWLSQTFAPNGIKELDMEIFYLTPSNPEFSVREAEWYVDGEFQVNDIRLSYTFYEARTYEVEARFTYTDNLGQIKTDILTKVFDIKQRPKYIVKLKKIRVTSYPGYYPYFANSSGNVSLKSYLRLSQNVVDMQEENIYVSDTNDINVANISFFRPITWNIQAADYQLVVYKEGGKSPYNIYEPYRLRIFGNNPAVNNDYISLGNIAIDLNDYRNSLPTTIDVSTSNLGIELEVEWN